MSYYNYCDDDYCVMVDFGDAGSHEVCTSIDIDIDLGDIADSEGVELLDYINDGDITSYVLGNYQELLPHLVEEACGAGLSEAIDAILTKWVEEGEIDYISDTMTKVKAALSTLTQEQLDLEERLKA